MASFEASSSSSRPGVARLALAFCKILVFSVGCILAAGTVAAMVLLAVVGADLGDCDLSCNQDTPGAQDIGGDVYRCGGKQSCGWTGFLFTLILIILGCLTAFWLTVIVVLCWRRARRNAAERAAAEEEANTTTIYLDDLDGETLKAQLRASLSRTANRHFGTAGEPRAPPVHHSKSELSAVVIYPELQSPVVRAAGAAAEHDPKSPQHMHGNADAR